GFFSFLSAPLIGALSDVWGRKYFLLITVFFTCAPIPLMRISPWWYFIMISLSGIFSVTFSVIFAYVADVTQEHERITAYGLVSATFAASLVTSPAIGAYLSARYGDNLVVLVATLVAVVDICFILLAVPESLPEKIRPASWGASISWEQAGPFTSLKKVRKDSTVLLICITVFLSYLPEAGQYSSFFLYLRQIIGFGSASIAAFIAVVGILSILAQVAELQEVVRRLHIKEAKKVLDSWFQAQSAVDPQPKRQEFPCSTHRREGANNRRIEACSGKDLQEEETSLKPRDALDALAEQL
ncbi:PREDICTED: hippocampus abundant transcript-like protein 1, partial [Nestor notabilis]|uniref:hippocampus abundant transcript-like protein 1 n=1 Tax=Nestor notabilis TaxID=176057 RepID=UPI00052323B4